MICQKCHEREATVFISQVVNQETTQMHLCAQCAGELGPSIHVGPLNLTPFGDFGDFLNDVIRQAQQMGEQIAQNIQLDPALLEQNRNPAGRRARAGKGKSAADPANPGTSPAGSEAVPTLQCPHCGYQFTVFQQTGRLGCARCYESFQPVLQPLITSIHGNVEHVEGEAASSPGTPAGGEDGADPLVPLRARLKEAIQKERFEEAARLRDEIHALEGRASREKDV